MSDRDPSDSRRRRLEGVIPELIKRAVEIGVEKAAEAPDTVKHFVNDLKLPKEIANYLLSQVEDTKNDVLRVVAKEMRDFLEHANLGNELQKILTTLQFEVSTTVRFRPNDHNKDRSSDDKGDDAPSLGKPEVKTDIYVKRDRERRRSRE